MKLRKCSLTDNIISGLIAGLIAIPLSVSAYRYQAPEPQPVESITIEAIESVPTKTESSRKESKALPIALNDPDPITESEIERISLGEFRITAYCPCEKCCGEWADGLTYTETVATEGRTIAVDPEVIPLGSIVELNGLEYVAEDIGGAIKGDRIDLYFNSHQDALEWGVQYLDIFLVEFPKLQE